jgi:hypothetical protein
MEAKDSHALRMRSFLNAIKDFFILRRPQGGRLEGRTTVDAAGIWISSHALKRGSGTVRASGSVGCPPFAGMTKENGETK